MEPREKQPPTTKIPNPHRDLPKSFAQTEDFRVNHMWIWLLAGLILVYLLLFATPKKTDTPETPQKKKEPHSQLREIDDRYVKLFDDEDELLEEFLIIDLLEEEEEEL